jgi:hypothetical protein
MSIRLSLRPIHPLLLAALFLLPCPYLTHAQTPNTGSGASLQAGALSISLHVSDHHFNGLQIRDAISHRTLNLPRGLRPGAQEQHAAPFHRHAR